MYSSRGISVCIKVKSIMLGVITCIFWVFSSKVDIIIRSATVDLSNDVRFGKIQLQIFFAHMLSKFLSQSTCIYVLYCSPFSECAIFKFIISFIHRKLNKVDRNFWTRQNGRKFCLLCFDKKFQRRALITLAETTADSSSSVTK